MYEFHKDKVRYFEMQKKVTTDFIIPFISNFTNIEGDLHILEIGCGEAGVLKAFTEQGHTCVGIELNSERIKVATKFFSNELANDQIRFINKNIYDVDISSEILEKFDLIILKDVIEHIHDQDRFMMKLKDFLKPSGKVFFGFPPWYMPFGGHQQMAKNKILAKLPYFHILPKFLYKGILKLGKEKSSTIDGLLEIKQTGITIERFEKIITKQSYNILKRKLFLINPIYKYKFGLKPKNQYSLISNVPVLRNFMSTCAYYVIGKKMPVSQ